MNPDSAEALLQRTRIDPQKFFSLYRMQPEEFDALLDIVRDALTMGGSQSGLAPIPPDIQLAVCL